MWSGPKKVSYLVIGRLRNENRLEFLYHLFYEVVNLYSQYHRDDYRPLVCFFEEEAGDGVGDVVFDEVKVDLILAFGRIFNGLFDDNARLLQELLALAQVDEPAADDVRRFAQAAVLGVDRRDDDKHPFLREHGAVADDDLLDVADGKAVYQAQAIGRALLTPDDTGALVADFYHGAVVGDDYFVIGASAGLGDVGVHPQHVVVAVHRHKEPRIYLLVDPKGFVAVGVARGVHVHGVAVDDARALSGEVVLELLHAALVARDDRGGEHDRVALFNFDVFVRLHRNAHQRGKLVALRAGREDDYFVVGQMFQLGGLDKSLFRHLQQPQVLNDFDVDLHTAALYKDFAAHPLCLLYHAHQALKLAGKGADDKAALRSSDDFVEVLFDGALGERESGPLHVGGVRAEEEHFAVGKERKLFFLGIGRHAVDVVEPQVARKHDVAVRGLDDDAHGVGDGVVYGKEADAETADFDAGVFVHLVDVDGFEVGELLLALAYHHRGEAARVDGRIADAVDDVGDAADVVEVAVRDKEPADFLAALLEVLGVGENVVDARGVVLAELEPAVDDDDVVAHLHHGHVFAYLLDTPQLDDADVTRLERRDRLLVAVEHRRVVRYLAHRVRLMRPRAAVAYAAAALAPPSGSVPGACS